jgi:Protein of unknown function (DUF3558)
MRGHQRSDGDRADQGVGADQYRQELRRVPVAGRWRNSRTALLLFLVDDININGHSGFIAVGNEPNLGDSLCEVGIQFQDDFIEWSVSFSQKPFPPPCDIAKELTRQSIANSK